MSLTDGWFWHQLLAGSKQESLSMRPDTLALPAVLLVQREAAWSPGCARTHSRCLRSCLSSERQPGCLDAGGRLGMRSQSCPRCAV